MTNTLFNDEIQAHKRLDAETKKKICESYILLHSHGMKPQAFFKAMNLKMSAGHLADWFRALGMQYPYSNIIKNPARGPRKRSHEAKKINITASKPITDFPTLPELSLMNCGSCGIVKEMAQQIRTLKAELYDLTCGKETK